MDLSWRHVFYLAEKMWELNQNNIAECLGVHRSTVSKLINGKQLRFSCRVEDIYKKLFDPTNEKSPACGKSEKALYYDFMQLIAEPDFDGDLGGLEYDDYKSLIISLLRAVKNNQPQKTISPRKKEVTTSTRSNCKNVTQSEPSPERTLSRQSIFSTDTMELVKSIPTNPTHLIKSIEADLKRPLSTTKKK